MPKLGGSGRVTGRARGRQRTVRKLERGRSKAGARALNSCVAARMLRWLGGCLAKGPRVRPVDRLSLLQLFPALHHAIQKRTGLTVEKLHVRGKDAAGSKRAR